MNHPEMNACLMEGPCADLMAQDAIEIKTGGLEDDDKLLLWAEVWTKSEPPLQLHRSFLVHAKRALFSLTSATGKIN